MTHLGSPISVVFETTVSSRCLRLFLRLYIHSSQEQIYLKRNLKNVLKPCRIFTLVLPVLGTPLQYSCLENPWAEEPGRLQSTGSWRVRHDWVSSLSLFTFMHWRKKWQPTPVFLPGESQGQRSLMGCHQGSSDFRLRSQDPCRLGTGESGLVLGWGMELRLPLEMSPGRAPQANRFLIHSPGPFPRKSQIAKNPKSGCTTILCLSLHRWTDQRG